MKRTLTRWISIALLLLAGVARGNGNDTRFSQTLNADDRAASGLTRLSSDEVAVIDALVRRDTVAKAGSTNSDKTPTNFSDRLTADERRTAGLLKLSAT